MIAVVEKRLGAPDILINSAGIHSGADILGSDDSTVRSVMDSSLLGTIFCTREVFGLMKRSGRGHIINIASQGAGWPGRWEAIYGTAKAAQVMFSLKTLAQFEFENEKIRKNGGRDSFFCHVLCPGAVDTPLQSKNKDKSSMLRTSDISDMIATLLLNPAHGLDSLADKAKNANYQIGPIGVFEKHQNIIRMFK
jgi:NAD(P)-dependent dehydrogenase (short-subunit alcohol dehydrogenase family)